MQALTNTQIVSGSQSLVSVLKSWRIAIGVMVGLTIGLAIGVLLANN